MSEHFTRPTGADSPAERSKDGQSKRSEQDSYRHRDRPRPHKHSDSDRRDKHSHKSHERRRRRSSSSSRSPSRDRGGHSRHRRGHKRRDRSASSSSSEGPSRHNAPPQPPPVVSQFKNDGSFLEMFKKMQEQQQQQSSGSEGVKTVGGALVGKRRGGRVLKTGVVKKAKAIEEQTVENPGDAWSLYLKEVKKYRETSCEEEGKTRPLVK